MQEKEDTGVQEAKEAGIDLDELGRVTWLRPGLLAFARTASLFGKVLEGSCQTEEINELREDKPEVFSESRGSHNVYVKLVAHPTTILGC